MLEVQDTIIDKLQADIPATNIYSYVPEGVEPPYIHASFPDLDENDTDTETGFSALLEVGAYSRYRGFKEVSDLNKAVYNSLHRVALPDTISYAFSGIHQEMSNIVTDSDGITRVSVQRFRIYFEPRPA